MSGITRSTRLAFTVALAIVLITLGVEPAWAVKAYPKPVTYYQPDGTPFEARMIGDERIVFVEDNEGHTIVRDRATGWYLYADPASHHTDQLRPTKYRPGKEKAPAGWKTHVRPAIDPAKLPGPPFVQQDDGSIAKLFHESQQQTVKSGRFGVTSTASTLTPTTVPVLVILVEFSDWKHTNGASTPVAGEPDFNPMAGQPNNAPTWTTLLGDRNVAGGLNHFYWEATYNRMQWNVTVAQRGKGQNGTGALVNDGWYVNPNTMAYWGAAKTGTFGACDEDKGSTRNGIKDLVAWAIQQADADVNFAQYDSNGDGSISDAELMIFVVHAREGQEMYGSGCDGSDPNNEHIWSHKWNIASNISVDGKTIPSGHIYACEPEFTPEFNYSTTPWTITDKFFGVGVFAHEALHTLGATDIYDTGYDATPAGDWDLMDSGSYNGARSGTHPAHMGVELKQDIKMNADSDAASYGFILESEITDVAGIDGVKNVAPLGGSSPAGVLARVKSPNNANEWFLIENRASVGYYEPYLPEHGLVIWHRDKAATVGNNSYPYEANVLRKGWANTATGLQTDVSGAAFSLDDNQTTFTATTDPNNKLNNGSASGIKDIRCVSAESSSMSFAYGTVSGAHVAFAGSTVSGGDGDEWIDAGETATLNVSVLNSSCAGAPASNVTAVVTSTSGTVSASLPASFASLAAGQSGTFAFDVNLTCATCSSITFDYVIYAGGTAVQSGSFTKDANRSYLWFDDADAQAKAGWSSSTSFVPSACTSAVRHGDWSVVPHPLAPRGNSYRAPVDANGLTFANPDEVWISPNVTIPAGANIRDLRFSYAAEIPCANYSRGRLWVSTDNGVTWKRHEDFYRDGGDLSWEEVTTSLAPYAGATQLRFMFAMYTYTCQTGCTATRGIYVDNIGVIIEQQQSGGSGDTQAPSTSITSPANGATVSGTTTVSADATDNVGVTRVDLLVDGAVKASDSSSPYSFSWDTTTASNGTHSLTTRAYDAAGNSATSSAVSVTVSNTVSDTQAPSTSITSPANGATVSGTTTVSASATDNVGVTRVEFFVDGALVSTDTTSPYSFAWDTTTVSNASHTLTTKAYDAAGNVGTSSAVSVTVNNSGADITAPVISNVTSVITNSKNGSFEIRWTTDEPATSVVTINGTRYTDTTLVTSHVRSFRGTKGATYTYYVESADAAGNTAQAGPFTHQN